MSLVNLHACKTYSIAKQGYKLYIQEGEDSLKTLAVPLTVLSQKGRLQMAGFAEA